MAMRRLLRSYGLMVGDVRHIKHRIEHGFGDLLLLISTLAALSTFYPASRNVMDSEVRKLQMYRLLGKVTTLAAMAYRHTKGLPYVMPDNDLSYVGNFMNMLWRMAECRYTPNPTLEKALDVLFILHADHEQNCSTNTMRIVASAESDPYCAAAAAAAALYGPLHGGANEAVFKILSEIDKAGADPVEYIKGLLAQKKKIPGFGHRVYHTEDPRATHLRQMSKELGESSGEPKWFNISRQIEEFVNADKKLNANVDFYSASTYHTLGIDIDLFTPIFAVSRISGWTAHVMEQLNDNRLIRPRAEYVGPTYPQQYMPIDRRG